MKETLNKRDKAVLADIARRCGTGNKCEASTAMIAYDVRLSINSTADSVKSLCDAGLISVQAGQSVCGSFSLRNTYKLEI